MSFTDLTARNARASDKTQSLRVDDTPGLFLLVQPGGGKSWLYRWKRGGRGSKCGLGSYPEVSLARARAAAAAKNDELAEGKTPLGAKREAHAQLRLTVADMLDRWRVTQTQWTPASASQARRVLARHVVAKIGDLPAAEVTTARLLHDVIDPLLLHSAVVAHETGGYLRRAFAWAKLRGYVAESPAADMRAALGRKPEKRRFPAVTTVEGGRAVLRAVEGRHGYLMPKLLHRFLALTALRISEAAGARWDEVEGLDGPAPVLRIPAARMKMGKSEHLVPLVSQAVEVLRAARKFRVGEHCFPHSPTEPLRRQAVTSVLRRAGFTDQHVAHGWRSCFSTVMNDRDVRNEKLVEVALAHVGKGTAPRYNRGDYLEARRRLMEEWAELLLDGAMSLREVAAVPARSYTDETRPSFRKAA